MSIIAMLNQKGGVGKSTSVLNLAAGLAMRGKTVAIVDMDPQGSLTLSCGYDLDDEFFAGHRISDVLQGKIEIEECACNVPTIMDLVDEQIESAGKAIKRKFCKKGEEELRRQRAEIAAKAKGDYYGALKDLMLIPANSELMFAEWKLLDSKTMAAVKKEKRGQIKKLGQYFDYVLIDCSPSFSLLTQLALLDADSVIVPTTCEYLSYSGMAMLNQTVDYIRTTAPSNPKLEIKGLIVQMYSGQSNKTQTEIINAYKEKPIYLGAVKRSVDVSNSTLSGVPVVLEKPNSTSSEEYLAIADEIIKRGI